MSHWLPAGFVAPAGTSVPYGHRLRPVRLSDGPRLCVAVAGLHLADAERLLRERLGELGAAHGVHLRAARQRRDRRAGRGEAGSEPRPWDPTPR